MFKLDNDFLQSLGLGGLPVEEKNKLLQMIYERLEMNVGMRLAEKMTDQQLDEFEGFIDRNDEAGALKWLETNFPNYKDVVAEELEKLKVEVQSAAPQILAAHTGNGQQMPPVAQPPIMPGIPPQPQSIGQPQMQQPAYQQPQYAPMPSQQPAYAQPASQPLQPAQPNPQFGQMQPSPIQPLTPNPAVTPQPFDPSQSQPFDPGQIQPFEQAQGKPPQQNPYRNPQPLDPRQGQPFDSTQGQQFTPPPPGYTSGQN